MVEYLRPDEVTDEESLKKALKQREDRLLAYQRRAIPSPFRYVVTVELPNTVGTPPPNQRFPTVEGNQLVRAGTVFHCESMGVSYLVRGTAAGVAVQVNLSQFTRLLLLQARFKVRDTGSDREWQNDWVPMEALLSGNVNALPFGRGRAVVSGGSSIVVSVDAMSTASAFVLSALGLSAVASHVFKFSFYGKEVPA